MPSRSSGTLQNSQAVFGAPVATNAVRLSGPSETAQGTSSSCTGAPSGSSVAGSTMATAPDTSAIANLLPSVLKSIPVTSVPAGRP